MRIIYSNLEDIDFFDIEQEIKSLDVFKTWGIKVDSVIYGRDGVAITLLTPKPKDPRETFNWNDSKRAKLESELKKLGHELEYVGLAASYNFKLVLYFGHK